MSSGKPRWKVIAFPAIAEKEDVLGRKPGDLLWPERFGPEKVREQKELSGERWWNALYQQRPAPDEGSILKRSYWKFYDLNKPYPEFTKILQSWEMSFKETGNSYVVGQLWGVDRTDLLLLRMVRKQMDFAETISEVSKLTLWAEREFPRFDNHRK